MKRFAYKGKAGDGRGVQGVLEVDDQAAAIARLREQGYYITSLQEIQHKGQITLFVPRGRIKAKHLAVMCRQFGIMLGAGMSLIGSLQLLAGQSDQPRVQKALEEIRLDVASGASLTRALEKHQGLFPHVFIQLIGAGELAGVLPDVLERLALYYEREDELRKKISEALAYPAVISAVALLMVTVMLFFVLPMLVGNFGGYGIEPPALTKAVLSFRDWLSQWWYALLVAVVLAIWGFRQYMKTARGKQQRDAVLLQVPIIGELQKMVIFSRFCRTLGLLLNSGISMLNSLSIVGRLIDNTVVNRALREARLRVEQGQGLSVPLSNHRVFSPLVVQMIAVGEEAGSLESVLVQLADYYDREVNFAVTNFTKFLEPAIMVVLAIVVLFILLSVYMPMMQMVTGF